MEPATSSASDDPPRRLGRWRAHPRLRRPIRLYLHRREQLLYLAVGAWNTVFGYGAWACLQVLLGGFLHYLAIVVLSWPIAVLNAYVGYRYVVFRSRGPMLRELPRFSLVYVSTLIVNLALLPVALTVLPLNIYAVQALFAGAVVVCSYVGHKYYSFGGSRRRDGGQAARYDPPAVARD